MDTSCPTEGRRIGKASLGRTLPQHMQRAGVDHRAADAAQAREPWVLWGNLGDETRGVPGGRPLT